MHITVIGAGSIGAFVGGHLRHAGHHVTFLAREHSKSGLLKTGIRLTDQDGGDDLLAPDQLLFGDAEAALSSADLIIVAVKSRNTPDVAAQIAAHAPDHATILSFQNGIRNKERLITGVAKQTDIRRVMVPWNVVQKTPGHFHRGTSGHLMIERGPTEIESLFQAANLDIETRDDMDSVLWGKLLLNLNNALNALSDLPLKTQLQDRAWRKTLAASQTETLKVLDVMGIDPKAALPLPPKMLPHLLRLPTFLYNAIAGRNLQIDEDARSSMWEDLQKGRPTEIADLQGEVVDRAREFGLKTPVLERTVSLVREAEKTMPGSPGLKPQDFLV